VTYCENLRTSPNLGSNISAHVDSTHCYFVCNKMSEIIVQEVRPRLFRINWVFSEAMIKDMGMYKETFQLRGSFSELSYTISCHLSKSPAETLKYKYDITVQESRSDKNSSDVSGNINYSVLY
jgi:hypothetical protein